MSFVIETIWVHQFGSLQVVQLAVLRDNYSYLIHDSASGATAVLDPADDGRIVRELERRNWSLQSIWNTHWHADHCGGNAALLEYARHRADSDPKVLGYSQQKIAECTHELRSGATVSLGNFDFQVYEVPGHTLDHLLFVYQPTDALGSNRPDKEQNSLAFCGDVLFSLGCGRLFEGSAAQLLASLDLISSLPQQTVLFCAHEYTRANLRFALSLERDNPALCRMAEYLALPEHWEGATIPSTLAFELEANPFLRVRQNEFSAAMKTQCPEWASWSAIQRLAKIRKMKDHF